MMELAHFVEMNCEWPFMLWPGFVLGWKFWKKQKMPWWAVGLLVSFGGMILVEGMFDVRENALLWQIDHGPQPPTQELVHRLVDDTGITIARQIEPLYVVLVSVPWLLIYGVAILIRRALKKP